MSQLKITVVGPRNLQNELLARFLEKEMGAEVACSIISCWKAGEAGTRNENHLTLLDFKNLDLKQFSQRLESMNHTGKPLAFAVFNVSPDHSPEMLTREMLAHGLRGVFNEGESMDLMSRGVRAVLNRELWIPRQFLVDLLIKPQPEIPTESDSTAQSLTVREKEILLIIASGASNHEIADQLFISPHTVRTHIHNIFAKIGSTSRLQAALWATSNLQSPSSIKTKLPASSI